MGSAGYVVILVSHIMTSPTGEEKITLSMSNPRQESGKGKEPSSYLFLMSIILFLLVLKIFQCFKASNMSGLSRNIIRLALSSFVRKRFLNRNASNHIRLQQFMPSNVHSFTAESRLAYQCYKSLYFTFHVFRCNCFCFTYP